MKEIIEKYKKWKKGKDEDYIHDEIFEFANSLGRADLVYVFDMIEQQYGPKYTEEEWKNKK